MSRITHLVRPDSEALNWKMAVPMLGLVLSAAFYTHGAMAQAAAKPEQRAVKNFHRDADQGREDAYALVRDTDQGTNMNADGADRKEIEAAKRKLQGDFLWFRDGGKTWVVQDKEVLAKANAAWAPVDRLGKEMDGYGKQMDEHGKKMDALGKQMEQAAANFEPDQRKTREFERKMEALGRQMEKLGDQMEVANGAERDRIERDMERLSNKMAELGRQFGKQQQSQGQHQAQASMDEIGRRMGEAGKPMGELGEQMGALGKQMEKESHAADKSTRALIRDAMARGLARPAPSQG